ncbi:MAG: hypothetical protein LC667_10505 [Thioalkalivibrio sp.]|nr:hypothetical protein [Thioalkalivibrio sp.]
MSHRMIVTRSRSRRPKPTGARFVRTTLGALMILAFAAACSPGGGTPAASHRWDDARWDTARWVAPAAGSVSPIAAGNELDAEPVRLALSTVEAEVGVLRDLVIETRRTQVRVRDRVSALEASVLGPSAHDPARELAARDVRTLESVANAGLEAGSIASSTSLNSVFTVLASDLMMARLVDGFLVRIDALEDGTAPFDYAGTWSGTMVDSFAGTGTTTITMSQTGSNLVGTWQATFPSLDSGGSLTGVVNEDEVAFELLPADSAACPFSGVAQRTGLTLTGTYEAFDCAEAITGTVTVTKQ